MCRASAWRYTLSSDVLKLLKRTVFVTVVLAVSYLPVAVLAWAAERVPDVWAFPIVLLLPGVVFFRFLAWIWRVTPAPGLVLMALALVAWTVYQAKDDPDLP